MSTILSSYNLSGGDTTSSVFTYSGATRNLDIEIITDSISGGAAYVTIETSADQTNWILVPNSQIQINRGSDSYVYHITESEGAYVRVRLFRMDAHSGTMTITASEAGGGGGTQTLNQTLVLGNTTGGEDISISNGDKIVLDNGSELRVGTYDFGGTGGISRICSVGYEDMWQSGIHHIFDNNGFIRESNNCFAINPDNTFDNTLRFKVGSRWVLDDGTTYMCTDASTGAADWVDVSRVPSTGGTPYTAIQYDVAGVAQEVNLFTDLSGVNSLDFDSRKALDTSGDVVIDYSNGIRLSDLIGAALRRTITPAGTTGNQTINKIAGTVNIAAGGSSVVVTNGFVDNDSIILCVVRTNDVTAILKNVIAAAGSFTIRTTAAVTAETSIGFMVTN